jgi:hypothetical protein
MSEEKIPTESFFERYSSGRALACDIDQEIELWHKSGVTQGLPSFLGITNEEYELWVSDSSVLPFILKSRSEVKDITST